jgi:hypothetical protein
MVEEAALIVIAAEPLYVVPELNVMLVPAVKLNRLEPKDTPDIVLFANPAFGMVVAAVTLPDPLAYMYPVKPVTARLVVVRLLNDSLVEPGILSQAAFAKIAQSPTLQTALPFKFVFPATDTT